MTEPSPSHNPRSKASALSTDTQKRKKNSRKKSDAKSSNIHPEHVEPKLLQENKSDTYTDIINYINRLEHDVTIAKKQLKTQRLNFRKTISTLAKHFDSQGISSDIIANYIKTLGKREAQVEDLQDSYDKFYTEYKYQIVQDPKNLTPQAKPKTKKSPEKSTENNSHNTDIDIPKLTTTAESLEKDQDNTTTAIEKTEKKKKKSTAKANGETNNEEVPKKRKYQKKQKPAEEEEKKAGTSTPDVQEIPAFTPGKDSAKKSISSSRHNEDSLRSYEEIPQLKQSEVMENNPYEGMRGYFNQLGMDPRNIMSMYMPGLNMMNMNMDGEYYNKMLQELMKSSLQPQMMNVDQSRQDVFNHYHQRNLK